MSEFCDATWGSHACGLKRRHDGPHDCGCCTCDSHPDLGADGTWECVAKAPYYGIETKFHGEDARQEEMTGYIADTLKQMKEDLAKKLKWQSIAEAEVLKNLSPNDILTVIADRTGNVHIYHRLCGTHYDYVAQAVVEAMAEVPHVDQPCAFHDCKNHLCTSDLPENVTDIAPVDSPFWTGDRKDRE